MKKQHSNVPVDDRGVEETLAEISEMASWGDPNRADDPLPDPAALAHASNWVTDFYKVMSGAGYTWKKPNVTLGAQGEVVLEWWNGQKALGVYIFAQKAVYVQEWGADIETEMSDGDAESLAARLRMWQWLTQTETATNEAHG